jgi:hypothetical protein
LSVVAGSGIGTVVSEGVDRTVATLIAIIIIITPAIPSSDFRTMCNQLFQGFVHGRNIIIMYIIIIYNHNFLLFSVCKPKQKRGKVNETKCMIAKYQPGLRSQMQLQNVIFLLCWKWKYVHWNLIAWMFINFYRAVEFAVNIYLGNAGPDNIFAAWICLRVVYRGRE